MRKSKEKQDQESSDAQHIAKRVSSQKNIKKHDMCFEVNSIAD